MVNHANTSRRRFVGLARDPLRVLARVGAFVWIAAIAMCGCTMYTSNTDGVPTEVCTDSSQSGACSQSPPTDAIGAGPRIGAVTSTAINMLVDGDRLLIGATALIAVDVRTGDRSVVSGEPYGSNTSVGSGPIWTQIAALRQGVDGAYYAAGTDDALYRVDGTSGDRTTVTLPPCDGLVAAPGSGFAFDPADGTLYSVASLDASFDSYNDGAHVAIVAIHDGTCRLVTESRGDYYRTPDVGSGDAWVSIVALQFDGGRLVAVDPTSNTIVSIDPRTGARAIVGNCAPSIVAPSARNDAEQVVATCGPLDSAAMVGGVAYWGMFYQAAPAVMRMDLTTGAWTAIPFMSMSSPGTSDVASTLVADPARPLVYVASGNAVFVFNTVTGQSDWLSAWTPATNVTAPSDPCATSTNCEACTDRVGCGWCDGACHTGDSSGPSSGACQSTGWAWVGSQC